MAWELEGRQAWDELQTVAFIPTSAPASLAPRLAETPQVAQRRNHEAQCSTSDTLQRRAFPLKNGSARSDCEGKTAGWGGVGPVFGRKGPADLRGTSKNAAGVDEAELELLKPTALRK